MEETYTLEVAGVKRVLPKIKITDELTIASFVILGDVEIVKKTAPLLAEKMPEVDVLVSAEAKGIPLVHEVAYELGLDSYHIARKSVKPYMNNPVIQKVSSITTQKEQILCFDENDAQAIQGKRVAIIDDVISTGESIRALEQLVHAVGGNVVAKAAILAEGDASERDDILFLQKLPLFTS